jgi:Bacteriophage clamp loader A subunit
MDENPDSESQYPPYIVNRCLSGFIDTIMYSNEMNINNFLDKKLQYDFYINIVRPKKRFTPWLKKEKLEDLELVKQYYGYSNEKARTALRILTEQQLEFIRTKLDKGGKK